MSLRFPIPARALRAAARIATLAAGLAAAAAFAAAGARADDVGPELGDAMPHNFTLIDQFGIQRGFDELKGEAGLIVFFNRSVDWCPTCRAQALEVNARLEELRGQGYEVVAITTDAPETLARFDDRRDVDFPLLSDADSELISEWGLLDPAFPEGDRRHGLPYPATFVLDPEGVVSAKLLIEERYGEASAFETRVTFDDVSAAARDALARAGRP